MSAITPAIAANGYRNLSRFSPVSMTARSEPRRDLESATMRLDEQPGFTTRSRRGSAVQLSSYKARIYAAVAT